MRASAGPPAAALIGRDAELTRLRALVTRPSSIAQSEIQVVLGDPGMGKTALLADVTRHAAESGLRVLSVTGRESEANLAYAGLHQLLRPALGQLDGLPAPQREALLGALGLSPEPAAAHPMLTGLAVLTLLGQLSAEQPVLVVAEDAHWLDDSSLNVLVFVGRRLAGERVALLFSARPGAAVAGLARDFHVAQLAPLGRADAQRLLDGQPAPPAGRAREQVLSQAAGNPLALIELSRAIAADPDAGRRWAAEPLPLTDRLTAVLEAQFAGLPADCRSALLLAAAADGADLPMAELPGLTAAALAPAEQAGLIRVDRTGPRFTHPLVRSAVYHAVPFAERAAAHRQLADALRDQPDRYAWQRAAATLGPDEEVARLLAAAGDESAQRGGAAATARAFERAAELSPRVSDRVVRLLDAVNAAQVTGQVQWPLDIATRALALATDPVQRLQARIAIGFALMWSDGPSAVSTLLAAAEEMAGSHPDMAWLAVINAAAVAYQGDPAVSQAIRRSVDKLGAGRRPTDQSDLLDVARIWVEVSLAPLGPQRAELVRDLRQIAAPERLTELLAGGAWMQLADERAFVSLVGGIAWLLEEPDTAVRLLRRTIEFTQAPGMRGASGAALAALQWVYLDTGRWDEALAVAGEAAELAAAPLMDALGAAASCVMATVSALRGDTAAARAKAADALAQGDAVEVPAVDVWTRRALGLAAFAEGAYPAAYAQLNGLFQADGTPVHYHVSYLGLADLAAAAVRAGRGPEASALIERALALLPPDPGPRVAQLAARARGLLAGPAEAEAHFTAGLADPAGNSWPFERAQLRLDYGEWLRRQRRINDAKPELTAALEVFRGLSAQPWTDRAETELRACGVSAADDQAPGALDGLTPQQRRIVILASRGLSNGEIGDRLFLSPRTVESHLYRSYPALGISGRHQLRDLVERAGAS